MAEHRSAASATASMQFGPLRSRPLSSAITTFQPAAARTSTSPLLSGAFSTPVSPLSPLSPLPPIGFSQAQHQLQMQDPSAQPTSTHPATPSSPGKTRRNNVQSAATASHVYVSPSPLSANYGAKTIWNSSAGPIRPTSSSTGLKPLDPSSARTRRKADNNRPQTSSTRDSQPIAPATPPPLGPKTAINSINRISSADALSSKSSKANNTPRVSNVANRVAVSDTVSTAGLSSARDASTDNPLSWDSVESDDWSRSLLVHMSQDITQFTAPHKPKQQNLALSYDAATMGLKNTLASQPHPSSIDSSLAARKSATSEPSYSVNPGPRSSTLRQDHVSANTITLSQDVVVADIPALSLVKSTAYPEPITITSQPRPKTTDGQSLQQIQEMYGGKLPAHIVPINIKRTTPLPTDPGPSNSLAIFGNQEPTDGDPMAIRPLSHVPKKTTGRRALPPASAGPSLKAPNKPVWRAGGPSALQSPYDGGLGPSVEPLRPPIAPAISPRKRAESEPVPQAAPPTPQPQPQAHVFNRQQVVDQYREKAKEVARRARTLVNAKAQRMASRESPQPAPQQPQTPARTNRVSALERDLDMFARIQSRVHGFQSNNTGAERRSLASSLNLNDDDFSRSRRASRDMSVKFRSRRTSDASQPDQTRIMSSVLAYTPESVRHRRSKRSHQRPATSEGGSINSISAVAETSETATNSANSLEIFAEEPVEHGSLGSGDAGIDRSMVNNEDLDHGLRKAQSDIDFSRLKTPRKVLVPRHADVVAKEVSGSTDDASASAPRNAAERIEQEYEKDPEAVEHRFRFFRDFEILLDREAQIQVDASNTLARTGDIVPATATATMSDDHLLEIAWNAFVHLRWMDEGPISAATAEAIYDAMIGNGLNNSLTRTLPAQERRLIDLERIVVAMERRHYVYLKAFTGHLRRLAQSSNTPITSGISNAFATLIFRCKCPETGDVYISPQLTQFKQIRDMSLAVPNTRLSTLQPPMLSQHASISDTRLSTALEESVEESGDENSHDSGMANTPEMDRQTPQMPTSGLYKRPSKAMISSTSSISSMYRRQMQSISGTGSPSGMSRRNTTTFDPNMFEVLDAATGALTHAMTSRSASMAAFPTSPQQQVSMFGDAFIIESQPVQDTTTPSLPLLQTQLAPSDPHLMTEDNPVAQAYLGPMYVDPPEAPETFRWDDETPQSLQLSVWYQEIVHTPFGAALELMMRYWNRIFSPQNDALIDTA